jgi:hypothetical protein
MRAHIILSLSAVVVVASPVIAQTTPSSAWRTPGGAVAVPEVQPASAEVAEGEAGGSVLKTAALPPRPAIANVTKGSGTLPNDQGQVWREYDITPYTLRVTTTARPEQAIVDWILRETGYEAWHSETVAMLSADRRTLRVYHTPGMQQIVGEIVDRFVNTQAESHAFGVQVMTLASPNWRVKALRMLKPVQTQTAGVQAWLLAKEDAATLVAELARRNDFRSHTSPHMIVNNGQSTVITLGQPRNYIRGLVELDGRIGLQPDVGQVFEGFSLELSPLLSLDAQMIDTIVKCNVDQVEKMIKVDIPTIANYRQQIEVPQSSGTRLQERFRWPVDRVLLISLGVVPSPLPGTKSAIALPLTNAAPRADLLLLIESKGTVAAAPVSAAAPSPTASAPARFVR